MKKVSAAYSAEAHSLTHLFKKRTQKTCLSNFGQEVVTVSSWTIDPGFKTYWLVQPTGEIKVIEDPKFKHIFIHIPSYSPTTSSWRKFNASTKTASSLRTRPRSYFSSCNTCNVVSLTLWALLGSGNKWLQNHGAYNTSIYFSLT